MQLYAIINNKYFRKYAINYKMSVITYKVVD